MSAPPPPPDQPAQPLPPGGLGAATWASAAIGTEGVADVHRPPGPWGLAQCLAEALLPLSLTARCKTAEELRSDR